MFTALLSFFVIFVAADIFFAAAVLYHLRQYTLPGWNAAKVVIPAYVGLSLLFLGLAIWSFLRITFIP